MDYQFVLGILVGGMCFISAYRVGMGTFRESRRIGRPTLNLLGRTTIAAICGAIIWPLGLTVAGIQLQTEYAIFRRKQGWRADSVVVLSALQRAGREMSVDEIDQAAGRSFLNWRVRLVILQLVGEGLVLRKSLRKSVIPNPITDFLKMDDHRFRVTDHGQMRLLDESVESAVGLIPIVPRYI